MLPCLQVSRLELSKLQFGGNDHVPQTVVGHEDLRVAEIAGGIAVVLALQHPDAILGPCLEVGRRSTHHHFGRGVACVIDIVETILFVVDCTACAQCGIGLILRGARGQEFTQRLVTGAILGSNSPERVEGVGGIVLVLLQIEHLEVASFLVVEGHRVATTSDGGIVIGLESGLVGGVEECGGAGPVLRGIRTEIVVAARCQREC